MVDQENSNNIPPIEVVRTLGSPIMGRRKNKTERIRDAMDDLQLVIDGSIAQLTPDTKPLQFSRGCWSFGAFLFDLLEKDGLGRPE